ncbi:MAG: polysaccharide deacetylase family protein [Oscillospiraceae bacterium]|nr:polysaccharide deacetylase family protein [Oscillospiraceae bacterium]
MKEKQEQAVRKKQRGRGWIVALAILAILLLTASMLTLLDARHVRFYMTGDEDVTLEYGTPYVEPGVYAVTAGRLFGELPERLPIETCGSVDSERLGTYVLRYKTRWFFADSEVERRVTIVDTTPPVIELRTIEGYTPTWLTGYAEEGYSASDNCDGDLTGKVRRTAEGERIVYTVSDSSGNTATVVRELPDLHYDPPVLTLRGDAHVTMEAGLRYEDAGCTAADNLGNDLSAYVETENEVVPWLAGEYEVRYSITSEKGDTIGAVRTVTVLPHGLPAEKLPEEKTIYLTFDDGPGPYTEGLLDLLKKYGVKATFFVTDQQSDYIDLIGRAFREGHSIGVHTLRHDYDYIYASEENYFEDFFAMEEIIYKQTGSYTQLFRFPGGSSNTVSRINPGIMTRLTQAMNDMGYQYFDWNVVSGDAGGTNKTKEIIQNIKDGCAEHRVSVILQHDIKDYSVAAVESVIKWGKENGYAFRALTLDSPGMHHGLNN